MNELWRSLVPERHRLLIVPEARQLLLESHLALARGDWEEAEFLISALVDWNLVIATELARDLLRKLDAQGHPHAFGYSLVVADLDARCEAWLSALQKILGSQEPVRPPTTKRRGG